jgi:hypothetical protein
MQPMNFPPPPHLRTIEGTNDPVQAIREMETWMHNLVKWLYNVFNMTSGSTNDMSNMEKFIYLMDTPNRYAELQRQIDNLNKKVELRKVVSIEALEHRIAQLEKQLALEV